MKTVIRTFFVFLAMMFQFAFAATLGIKDIAFDNSDNIIFVSTDGSSENILVKKGVLKNPDRIYFDIENAVLKKSKSTYDFQNGKLSEFKISQFSTEPPVVRIVMTHSGKLDVSKVKVLAPSGGSLIIKLNDVKPEQNFLTLIYRETKTSTGDYLEKLRVYEEVPQNAAFKDDIISTVNKSLDKTMPENEPVRLRPPLRESKLLTRYFVQNAAIHSGNVLISGTGIITLERPIYLINPNRIVFDIPNAVISKDLAGKELKISETEKIKIAQFEPTKVRIAVTTNEPGKWRPIFSGDLQNILIAHDDRLESIKLYNSKASINSVLTETASEYSTETKRITFNFNFPVVQSVKRTTGMFEVVFDNVTTFDPLTVNKKLAAFGVELKPGKNGSVLTIPLKGSESIECYETLNAKQFVIRIKAPKSTVSTNPGKSGGIKPPVAGKILSGKVIVLDPGHGGSDPGAIGGGIQEKTMTLELALMLEKLLKTNGATVYMTRTNDTYVGLAERTEFSDAHSPDLFVSLHINAAESSSVNGIETHFWKDDSENLAKCIQSSLVSRVNARDRGVLKSRFYVVRNTVAPSVLVEFGFISNDSELKDMLTNTRKTKSVEAVFEGISNFLKGAVK